MYRYTLSLSLLVIVLLTLLGIRFEASVPNNLHACLLPQREANGESMQSTESPLSDEKDDDLLEQARAVFGSIEPVPESRLSHPKVELGRELFWDRRLSSNGQIACASCHLPEHWGADGRLFSIDAKGKPTKRNSQTVFNSTLQPGLRWVADRKSAAHQAERSLTGSMGFDKVEDVVPLLVEHGYEAKFQAAFPDDQAAVTPQNYAVAIEAYEDTLRTPSAFDRYLAGERDGLNVQQKQGLKLFLEIGCTDCHSGPLLGGSDLQTFGVHKDYWMATGSKHRDAGLFESTEQEADRNVFRVSMLRNIAKTAPYFHDGSVAGLTDAVRVMAAVQLDRKLDDSEAATLVEFLHSLTGEIPLNYQDPFQQK